MDKTLDERVEMFRTLELPGQPQMMHMGTSYLVNDLYREVKRLRKEIEEADTDKENSRLKDLLHEVAISGVEHNDERIGYVTVQINRCTWDVLQELKRKGDG